MIRGYTVNLPLPFPWPCNRLTVDTPLGHMADSLFPASHEIDGVRKEKERLTAAWTSHTFGLTAHFSFLIAVPKVT